MLIVLIAELCVHACTAGTFAAVLSSLDPEGATFKQRMDALNRFCRDKQLDQPTRRHLRSYMIESRQVQVAEANTGEQDHRERGPHSECCVCVSMSVLPLYCLPLCAAADASQPRCAALYSHAPNPILPGLFALLIS